MIIRVQNVIFCLDGTMLRQENVRNIKYHKIRNRKGTPDTVDTWPLYWKDETLIALDLCKSNCNVMQKS